MGGGRGQGIVKEKPISERLLLRGAGLPLRSVQEKECSERDKNVRKSRIWKKNNQKANMHVLILEVKLRSTDIRNPVTPSHRMILEQPTIDFFALLEKLWSKKTVVFPKKHHIKNKS